MDPDETTEMRLVRTWRSGDRDAGDKLLRRYAPILHSYFSRRVGRNVDDLVQRTLLACIQSMARYEGRSSFKSYLLGIAQNQFLMSLRSDGPLVSSDVGLSTSPEQSPSQLVAFRQEQLILVMALVKVEPEFRLVLKLFYWGGRSVEEIAEELGIRPGTVKSRLARGRAMLRANVIGMNLPQKVCEEALQEVVGWTHSRQE
jgi:RNA polymerase sigma-70 factor (ECF subfamily)